MIQNALQLTVSGIAMGFIYALVAIEYTLVWNSTGLLNFSHDKFIMISAYLFAGTFILRMNMTPMMGVIMSLLVMFIFGAVVAMTIFNPLRNMSSPIFAVMGTIVLGRILTELARIIWGPAPFSLPKFLSGKYKIGNVIIARANVWIIVVSLIIVAVMQFFFKATKAGKAMRCVSQNKMAASLMGIDVTKNIVLTIALSAMICTAIGILVIPLFNIDNTMANMIGLKGFAAGVVGGFGYLPGAIVGGLIIGILENISVTVFPAVYKDCVAFVLLIAFLLFKPTGVLGNRK
ncbi:ABC-type transporter, integral membrane subunit [Tepidanaerobacter acetatoxydans Re1]|uniref:ABC-type transporter, integral membrane subunit n=1 Tax=Tepidanaerobacter acetatoxydans (strain DSM 21804 / JCM 16047 / Re1) TaxID=1209989 RepID=F4LXL4_TEPAE|nr:branched-chain amino acid ABC transporter permease [Tepidanaerobacter acetatoxydans]AEE91943.1 ABC-type transporter, integral membrane subunit [Tepidanaerobacter acetatoxydans Re1]CDI40858.1 ABC-type transporter, integral membrane subunit [Tepidanaerobacter acetatoxydans Re1]